MRISFKKHIESIVNDYANIPRVYGWSARTEERPEYMKHSFLPRKIKSASKPYERNLGNLHTLSIKPSQSSYTNALQDFNNLKIDDSFYKLSKEKEKTSWTVGFSFSNFFHLAFDIDKDKTIIIHYKQTIRHDRGHDSSYWGKNYYSGFYEKSDKSFEIRFIDLPELKNKNPDIYLSLVKTYKNELVEKKIFPEANNIGDIVVLLQTENIAINKELAQFKSTVNEIKEAIVRI